MINVLFFAYEFPPVQTTGAIRPLKFVKNLQSLGYNPIVITTDIESGQRSYKSAKIDYSLLDELDDTIEIIRIPTTNFESLYKNRFKLAIHHYFSVNDNIKDNWGRNIHPIISEIINKFQPKLIYATAPPFGVAPIASKVSKKYSIPLVLDMRDHWSLWGTSAYISWIHYYFTLKLERKTFNSASAIISVTKQVINDFISSHPNISKNKFHVIPNGFEESKIDYNGFHTKDISHKKICIGYMGEFYYSPASHNTIFKKWYKKRLHRMFQYIPRIEDYKYRSPYYFLKILKRIIDDYPQLKSILEFHYVGSEKEWLNNMIKEFGLTDNFIQYGKVNYEESLQIASNFDYCLSTSIKIENGEDYALASKTFDYLTLKKPIIGVVSKGAQKDFLSNCGAAYNLDPDNTQASADLLFEILNRTQYIEYNQKFLNEFSRENSAKKLSTIFNNTLLKKTD